MTLPTCPPPDASACWPPCPDTSWCGGPSPTTLRARGRGASWTPRGSTLSSSPTSTPPSSSCIGRTMQTRTGSWIPSWTGLGQRLRKSWLAFLTFTGQKYSVALRELPLPPTHTHTHTPNHLLVCPYFNKPTSWFALNLTNPTLWFALNDIPTSWFAPILTNPLPGLPLI